MFSHIWFEICDGGSPRHIRSSRLLPLLIEPLIEPLWLTSVALLRPRLLVVGSGGGAAQPNGKGGGCPGRGPAAAGPSESETAGALS